MSSFNKQDFKTPPKQSSNLRTAEHTGQRQEYSPLKPEDEEYFLNTLELLIRMENDLEKAKQDLALQKDFNLFSGFKMLDRARKGFITIDELREALADLGVRAGQEELSLYFLRYDKDRDGRLRFAEYCDSFNPVDQYTQTLLNRRMESDSFMSSQTKDKVRKVWNVHFDLESKAEEMRQRLIRKPDFRISDAFERCDIDHDGVVKGEELQKLLESRGILISNAELIGFMDRIDKNRDGKITFAEFEEEIRPHSPSRA